MTLIGRLEPIVALYILRGKIMEFIKVEVFIPDVDKWKVIDALNKEEILKDDGYDSVFSETPVTGHFTPLEGSDPDIGNIGEHTTVDEVKLEFRIRSYDKDRVDEIIKASHPYEVPMINYIKLL